MLKKGMLGAAFALLVAGAGAFAQKQQVMLCLLYTSDAADEL